MIPIVALFKCFLIVLEIPKYEFENLLTEHKHAQGVTYDQELSATTLRAVIDSYKDVVLKHTGSPFPEDPVEQALLSIEASFVLGTMIAPLSIVI